MITKEDLNEGICKYFSRRHLLNLILDDSSLYLQSRSINSSPVYCSQSED